jgi:ArsR family transcriptional regulator, arsenate/arsenite/antimonite-responsive transcriptional repressor
MTSLPLVECCAPLAHPTLSDEEAIELEQVFKALADRHRVKILNTLIAAGGEEVCVCDFTAALPLKQSTVSYHLKQLVDAGLILRQRRGTFAYYRVAPGALERVSGLLAAPASAVAAAA